MLTYTSFSIHLYIFYKNFKFILKVSPFDITILSFYVKWSKDTTKTTVNEIT